MRKSGKRNRRLLVLLLVITTGMFGFGFVLIPIYRLMSNVYGFGGQFSQPDKAELEKRRKHAMRAGVDSSRKINLQFTVIGDSALPLELRPLLTHMSISPGEVREVSYQVRNLSGQKIVVQALPVVSPDAATRYLVSFESFCCKQIALEANETRKLPVKFVIDPDIPGTMHALTLSYRFIVAASVDAAMNRHMRVPAQAVIAMENELL